MTIDDAYRVREFLSNQILANQLSLKAIDDLITQFVSEQNKPKVVGVVENDISKQG